MAVITATVSTQLLSWLEQVSLYHGATSKILRYSRREIPSGCFAYELWDLRIARGGSSYLHIFEICDKLTIACEPGERDDGVFLQIELGDKKIAVSVLPYDQFFRILFPSQRHTLRFSVLSHVFKDFEWTYCTTYEQTRSHMIFSTITWFSFYWLFLLTITINFIDRYFARIEELFNFP